MSASQIRLAIAAAALCFTPLTMATAQPSAPCPTMASTPDADSLFFVSSREASCARGVLTLGNRRSTGLNFGDAVRRGSRFRLAGATWPDWWSALRQRLADTPTHRLLVYIHGYNNSPGDALKRARAIAIATRFEGPVVVVLWPSQANFVTYTFDETNADWSQAYFRWLLPLLAQAASSVSLVSHSMGNRISWDGVRDLAGRDPLLAAKIGRFVLASPDVDRGALSRDMPKDFAPLPDVTVYASSDDRPLRYSSEKHGHARAGDLGPQKAGNTPPTFPITAPNTTLVDTSDVRHKGLGHGDFIETPVGAADLCRIIAGIDPSPGRKASALPRTWKLLRNPAVADFCADSGQTAANSLE